MSAAPAVVRAMPARRRRAAPISRSYPSQIGVSLMCSPACPPLPRTGPQPSRRRGRGGAVRPRRRRWLAELDHGDAVLRGGAVRPRRQRWLAELDCDDAVLRGGNVRPRRRRWLAGLDRGDAVLAACLRCSAQPGVAADTSTSTLLLAGVAGCCSGTTARTHRRRRARRDRGHDVGLHAAACLRGWVLPRCGVRTTLRITDRLGGRITDRWRAGAFGWGCGPGPEGRGGVSERDRECGLVGRGGAGPRKADNDEHQPNGPHTGAE
ncbi:hypothetical protein SAMN05421541_1421 [Actinoplanes philippinensis]|uniref:Uncharacterized protein n=1 Tax=Actinoplanes philippinensis TaxID=35752 RepID=A0A1I2NAD8_9ACTN|nr:hypothetical protein SAMN05421541_1421 [Actinoplanes philippinensis]